MQNSPLPGAGLIKYTVEQVFKVFMATEKEDLEKIRKDIQDTMTNRPGGQTIIPAKLN